MLLCFHLRGEACMLKAIFCHLPQRLGVRERATLVKTSQHIPKAVYWQTQAVRYQLGRKGKRETMSSMLNNATIPGNSIAPIPSCLAGKMYSPTYTSTMTESVRPYL